MADAQQILDKAREYWASVGETVETDNLDVAALWEDFDRILNPDTSKEDCPECGGEGFRTQVRGFGMNAVEFNMNCTACAGTGLVEVP